MGKVICPAGCGKKFISLHHANKHADDAHSGWKEQPDKRKKWVTPYGFADFTHPVSYEEACKTMLEIAQKMFPDEKKKAS